MLNVDQAAIQAAHERGFESGYSAAIHDARAEGSRAHSELNRSRYVTAARQLNENLPDSLPQTDEIRTRADADEVLRVMREHADALEQERETFDERLPDLVLERLVPSESGLELYGRTLDGSRAWLWVHWEGTV